MDPNLQLDSRTACPRGNTLASELEVSHHGGHLIVTSLNLDLSELESLEAPGPVLVLADTVRIKKNVRYTWSQSYIPTYDRELRFYQGCKISRSKNT
jgi:hypothetical protein